MTKNELKHRTERVVGVVRSEIYELDDMVYVEMFDDITDERLFGDIKMYGGVTVCSVNEDGSIHTKIPTEWVVNRKGMMDLVADIQKLDKFIAIVCDKYE